MARKASPPRYLRHGASGRGYARFRIAGTSDYEFRYYLGSAGGGQRWRLAKYSSSAATITALFDVRGLDVSTKASSTVRNSAGRWNDSRGETCRSLSRSNGLLPSGGRPGFRRLSRLALAMPTIVTFPTDGAQPKALPHNGISQMCANYFYFVPIWC